MKSLLYILLFVICSQAYSQSLKLIHPIGGERFTVGDSMVIKWENIDSTDLVQIDFSTNNGIDWNIIDTTRGFSYIWKNLPDSTLSECIIKVRILSQITNSSEHTLIGSNDEVEHIAFHPSGNTIASADQCDILIWNLHTQSIEKKLTHGNLWVWSLIFSPDAKRINSTHSNRIVHNWDIDSNKILQPLFVSNNQIYSIAYSNDGKYLALGGYDSIIFIIDVETKNVLKTFNWNTGYVSKVLFSADGKHLITGHSDNVINIWSFETDELLRTLKGHSGFIIDISINPNGQTIASSSADSTIKLWNISNGELIHSISEKNKVYSLEFSKDGKNLASSSGNDIHIWDVETWKKARTFTGHTNTVTCLAYSPDNKFIATGSKDLLIKIWRNNVDTLHLDQSSSPFSIVSETTSIKNQNGQNRILSIRQNPSDEKATIELNLIEEGISSLKIYNSNGFLMESYGFTTSGSRTIEVDTKNFSNGLYFITIETPTLFDKAKLMLVR
ncbi:MAG: WD40 repeat domain-containing protein [Candidatus Kapabacteria bacterium]|nr:WD40 repeat domain-containing protein [Candidatus Kapabacteria bacterium]